MENFIISWWFITHPRLTLSFAAHRRNKEKRLRSDSCIAFVTTSKSVSGEHMGHWTTTRYRVSTSCLAGFQKCFCLLLGVWFTTLTLGSLEKKRGGHQVTVACRSNVFHWLCVALQGTLHCNVKTFQY